MIGALRGIVHARDNENTLILDVQGVGYVVNVTPATSAALGEKGTEVALRVHTRVREDAITLYGFRQTDELRCFEALVSTHGVGPSLAMAILGVYSPVELQHIVFDEDATALSRVPGVGKKTAVRLLVELQSKFANDVRLEIIDVDLAHGSTVVPESGASKVRVDVTAALNELGYSGEEIRSALRSVATDGSTEDVLRLALRELAAQR